MGRSGAASWAIIAAGLVALALAVLLLLKLLGALPVAAPPPSPAGPSAASTLRGGVVSSGTGWTIREADMHAVPGAGGTTYPKLVATDARTIYLEAGGSGALDCASNFTGIALGEAGELRLTHRVGDGLPHVCTDDYRFTYFEIRAAGATDLGDVREISIYEGDRRDVTYSSDDWTSGRFTVTTP